MSNELVWEDSKILKAINESDSPEDAGSWIFAELSPWILALENDKITSDEFSKQMISVGAKIVKYIDDEVIEQSYGVKMLSHMTILLQSDTVRMRKMANLK